MDANNCTSYNYSRELQSCTSMGVNCTGEMALLAGRRVLGLINLDNPSQLYFRQVPFILLMSFLIKSKIIQYSTNVVEDRVRKRNKEFFSGRQGRVNGMY